MEYVYIFFITRFIQFKGSLSRNYIKYNTDIYFVLHELPGFNMRQIYDYQTVSITDIFLFLWLFVIFFH